MKPYFHGKMFLIALAASASLMAADAPEVSAAQPSPEATPFVPAAAATPEAAKPREDNQGEFLIPNAPILKPTNIITIRAIGLGVAPMHTMNRAQEMALAKRAAIVDGYRQLGEKMHGIRINAKDTVKDAVLTRTEIRTELYSIVRNAEVLETIWENGLCQVEMEVKLDGRRWYRVLAGAL